MKEEEKELVALDLSNSSRQLWLVKVPVVLGKAWHEACEQSMKCKDPESDIVGRELGRVRYVADTNQGSQEMQLKVTTGPENVKAYRMGTTSEVVVPQYIFSTEGQTGEPGAMSCEGVIKQKFDLKPLQVVEGSEGNLQVDKEYRALNRERRVQAEKRLRVVQQVEERDVIRSVKLRERMQDKKKQKFEEVRAPSKQRASMKLGRDELQRLLMELFDRQQHWHFLQLQKETRQPGPWLKEVLNSVAMLNKRGPHKDLYELQKSNRQ